MKHKLRQFLPLIIFVPFFAFITYFYYQRIGSFGCADDCFNIIGGYFLLHGKEIYKDFFFNHAPLMAFISFGVQSVAHPQTLYQLLLYHRLSLYLFSFVFGLFLIFRFKWSGLGFLIFFETIKFYIFGDRFLAESYIIYPLVYLLGVGLSKLSKLEVKPYDYIACAIFTWFVIFTREPYAPLALFMFAVILWGKDKNKNNFKSLAIFTILSMATILFLPIHDFYQNVFVFNQDRGLDEIFKKGNAGKSLLATFFYEVYSIFVGQKSLLRILLIGLDISFILISIFMFFQKQYKVIFFLIIILGLANIRFETPGLMYFQAFHMVAWYALVIFSIFFLLMRLNRKQQILVTVPMIFVLVYSVISRDSFIRPNLARASEFNTSYATEFAYGTVIKELAKPTDTLFLEDRDDLIYFVADLKPAYKYSWLTSFMPVIPMYQQARIQMFKSNPPDFYYDACKKGIEFPKNEYKRLELNGKPSCLLVLRSKIPQVSDNQAEAIKSLGFSFN